MDADPMSVRVIAEAAQGFEGDPALARLLVRGASAGGADVVKFQLVLAAELATQEYEYYGLFQQLEMSVGDWESVAQEARAEEIGIAFDIFGPESLRLAVALGAESVKVHSTDFFNTPLMTKAIELAPRVLFSVGGIEVDDIAALLEPLGHTECSRMTMMFGFQAEPTATEDNNVARLGALRERFPDLSLGFMDHSDGERDEAGWLGVLALPYGVSVIEKHVTLDRSLRLEDYVSALRPGELAAYIRRIRVSEAALGDGSLDLSPAEQEYGARAVKTVVAATALEGGSEVGAGDVALLRAPPDVSKGAFRRLDEVLGRVLSHSVERGQPIKGEDLK
jgi:N,N'-diacetyllegionaminate synthase